MSYNGSEREFIFNLYESHNKDILEKALGLKLNDIVLEEYYKGLKIDIYGIEVNKGIEVFVETQLLRSDNRHKAKVLALVDRMERGIIVWQSTAFSDEHLEEVINRIKVEDKLIDFYAVKINSDLYPILDELNCKIHLLNVIDNLKLLDIVESPVNVVKTYKSIEDNMGRCWRDRDIDLRLRKKANQKLLEELKHKIYYFPTFHRQKSRLENRIIAFGFGKSGLQMFMSLADRRNRTYVELQFSEDNRHVYEKLRGKKDTIKKRTNMAVMFDDNEMKIGVYGKPEVNIENTIKWLVSATELFVIYFTNYTHYFEAQHMWKYNKKGIL